MKLWPPAALWIALAASPLVPAQAPAPPVEEAAAEPEAPAVAAPIAAVTLYSDQALVVRKASVDLPAGRSRRELAGLPEALLDGSVRARVTGTLLGGSPARLAGIEVRERRRTVWKKKEAEAAEAALKEIQARHKRAADAIQGLEREAALLKGLEPGKQPEGRPEKAAPAPLGVAAWQATLQFVDGALVENRKRARELSVELDSIEDELAVAAAHAQKLQSSRVHSEKAVVLELESAGPARVDLEIAYLVPGPGWWPRYDIRADVDGGKVELTSYALVRQETGEDWSDVELSFSAAEPARAADLPELLAWHIGEAETRPAAEPPAQRAVQVAAALIVEDPKEGPIIIQDQELEELGKSLFQANQLLARNEKQQEARRLAGGKAGRTLDVLRKVEEQKKAYEEAARQKDWGAYIEGNRALADELKSLDARHQVFFADDFAGCSDNIARGERLLRTARLADGIVAPVQSSRGYDFKYRALRRESIPSDGAFNKVVLGVEEFPAEYVYEAAPLMAELAFLTTRIKNQRRQPYLEGPASVFLGPDFVGDGRVPTTARGEAFPVELGADESVPVRRIEDRKRDTTGLFTSYHRYRHTVEVTVKNQKARGVRLAVLDRAPYCEGKGLEVERRSASPEPTMTIDKGLLRWDFPLDPGQELKITFAYTVELPAQKKVAGALDGSVAW